MALFWFLTVAMTAIALAFVVVPLLRARAPAGPDERQANLEILRGQRREIEADIAAGTLPLEARDEALAELVERAAKDLADPPPEPRAASGRPWPAVVSAALVLPLLAFGTYLAVGSPAAVEATAAAAAAHTATQLDETQVIAMVESLAAKMKERPDDPKGWGLLARSMASLGRFQESADAYARLAKLQPGDAQVLADYADALGMAQGRTLAGKPRELVEEALRIDPGNAKALALAGTAAAEAGDHAAAIRHWEALRAQLPAESDDARQVAAIIDDIRKQAPSAGKAREGAAAAAKARAGAPAGFVSGSVALAPGMGAKLTGEETVFILARAEGGPRVPLAVVRAQARDLPLKFALDDSQAMAAGMNLSSAKAVRVEARVSRSGEAMPRSGDLVGSSAVVKPGARDVSILVDKVLP